MVKKKAVKRGNWILLGVVVLILLIIILARYDVTGRVISTISYLRNDYLRLGSYSLAVTSSPKPSPSPATICCSTICYVEGDDGEDVEIGCKQTTPAECNKECTSAEKESCDSLDDPLDFSCKHEVHTNSVCKDNKCRQEGHCEQQDDGTGLCVAGKTSDVTKYCIVYDDGAEENPTIASEQKGGGGAEDDSKDRRQCNHCAGNQQNPSQLWRCVFGKPAGSQVGCDPRSNEPNQCNHGGCIIQEDVPVCRDDAIPGPVGNGHPACLNDEDCANRCCRNTDDRSCRMVPCGPNDVKGRKCVEVDRDDTGIIMQCEEKGCCTYNDGSCRDDITRSQCTSTDGIFNTGACRETSRNLDGDTQNMCTPGRGCCEYRGAGGGLGICEGETSILDCRGNGGTWIGAGLSCSSNGKCGGYKLVILDAGHGGRDGGAPGDSLGIPEKTINLDMALKLKSLLEGRGYRVKMTRTSDVYISINDRVTIANNAFRDEGADIERTIFVSIHQNSVTNREAHGTETLYYLGEDRKSELSRMLATNIVNQVSQNLGLTNRGIVARNDLGVIIGTRMPPVIAEVAFISNPNEEALLNTPAFRQNAARAIADVIDTYFAR